MSVAVEMVLRSSLVLAVGLVLMAVLRRQPAALRHWTLAAALACAAAQPALNWMSPAWSIAGLNWAASDTLAAPAVSTEVAFGLAAVQSDSASTPQQPGWFGAAYRVWMTGVIVSVGILLIGAVWLTWLTSRAREAGPAWQRPANLIRHRLGIQRVVRIGVTDHPALLVTWGVATPVILLPRTASTWPAERIELVLAHEMGHVVRHDWLLQLAGETLRAINWFNPLFWIACARLRRESEYACDDIVLALGTGGSAYAGHLVELARSFSAHGRTWLPAPSIARPSTLERRVRAMLNSQVDRRPVSRIRKGVLALALVLLALPIAAASFGESANPMGVLRDPSGRVLPNATVRLTAVATPAVHETVSDGGGAFQFADVPNGDYLLSARLPGFLSSRQPVRIGGQTEPLAITLQVGTLQEMISVTSRDSTAAVTKSSGDQASAAPPACGATELGGNLKPPKKLRDVRPRYRQAMIDANVEGSVLLHARVGVDGRVRELEVVSPVHADLEDEAIAAVSQWEFSPTYLNCEAIEVRMYVTVSFKLDR